MISSIEQANELILSGNVVAIPTETVYGLAADAFNLVAVEKTFKIIGRPQENPLIVHISNLAQLEQIAHDIPDDALRLIKAFWPGPLTIVLKKKPEVPDIVTAGLDTVAVRMPNHDITLALIEKTGPLTAPSANKSGKPSPTKPEHIIADYDGSVSVIDGGHCKIGIESTVVDLSEDDAVILRPGFITSEMISDIIGKNVSTSEIKGEMKAKSPGTRYTHYKPKAQVKWLDETDTDWPSKSYFLFHTIKPKRAEINYYYYNRDYSAFARDLYDHFRTADHLGYSQIFIEKLKNSLKHPIIPALIDRIQRAIM